MMPSAPGCLLNLRLVSMSMGVPSPAPSCVRSYVKDRRKASPSGRGGCQTSYPAVRRPLAKSWSLSGICSSPDGFRVVRVGQVSEQSGTSRRDPFDLVDAIGRMTFGESSGVATVALEAFAVVVSRVFAGLSRVRGDSSVNECCVESIERPNRVSEAVQQRLATPVRTNRWRTRYPENRQLTVG
jgi:hypothetical protein